VILHEQLAEKHSNFQERLKEVEEREVAVQRQASHLQVLQVVCGWVWVWVWLWVCSCVWLWSFVCLYVRVCECV